MIVPVAAVALIVVTSAAFVSTDASAAVVPASVSVVPFVVIPLVSPTTAALSYSKRVEVPLVMVVVPTVRPLAMVENDKVPDPLVVTT